jgi:hypothetical protein
MFNGGKPIPSFNKFCKIVQSMYIAVGTPSTHFVWVLVAQVTALKDHTVDGGQLCPIGSVSRLVT